MRTSCLVNLDRSVCSKFDKSIPMTAHIDSALKLLLKSRTTIDTTLPRMGGKLTRSVMVDTELKENLMVKFPNHKFSYLVRLALQRYARYL